MRTSEYIVFILSHGRAKKVDTYKTLRDQGYTGRIGIVIDDEDEQGDAYRKKFGTENVFEFNKAEVAKRFDEVIKGDRRTVVYARNACFDIAKRIGVKYFIELDDDYTYFSYTFDPELEWCRKREKKRYTTSMQFSRRCGTSTSKSMRLRLRWLKAETSSEVGMLAIPRA